MTGAEKCETFPYGYHFTYRHNYNIDVDGHRGAR